MNLPKLSLYTTMFFLCSDPIEPIGVPKQGTDDRLVVPSRSALLRASEGVMRCITSVRVTLSFAHCSSAKSILVGGLGRMDRLPREDVMMPQTESEPPMDCGPVGSGWSTHSMHGVV